MLNKNYFTPQSQAVCATTISHKFSLHVVYLTILHVYKIRLRENSYCTGTNFRWKKCYRRFWYAKRTGSMLTLRNWFQKNFRALSWEKSGFLTAVFLTTLSSPKVPLEDHWLMMAVPSIQCHLISSPFAVHRPKRHKFTLI